VVARNPSKPHSIYRLDACFNPLDISNVSRQGVDLVRYPPFSPFSGRFSPARFLFSFPATKLPFQPKNTIFFFPAEKFFSSLGKKSSIQQNRPTYNRLGAAKMPCPQSCPRKPWKNAPEWP
jgi:hypothetical protein